MPARLKARTALALGLAQGPTELLPVSSSAHTTLIPLLLDWPYAELDGELRKSLEVALHAGAGLALAIDMRRELLEAAGRPGLARIAVITLSLAPAALAGLALGPLIERRLGDPHSIAAALAAGGVAMAIADCGEGERGVADARPSDGLALGLAQAVALIPGVSRHGAALSVARARGFSRADAQTLSWHAGLPVLMGASVLKGARLARAGAPPGTLPALAGGAAGAFVSTLLSARLWRRSGRAAPPLLACSLYRCLLAAIVVGRAPGALRAQ